MSICVFQLGDDREFTSFEQKTNFLTKNKLNLIYDLVTMLHTKLEKF
jgi:hypothetical protein